MWLVDLGEVTINGARYVPAVEATPQMMDILRALAVTFYGSRKAVDMYGFADLRVHVTDDEQAGVPFDEFASTLAQMMQGA